MLVELHQATPAALPVAQTLDLEFAGRRGLEAALKELDRAWHGGPWPSLLAPGTEQAWLNLESAIRVDER